MLVPLLPGRSFALICMCLRHSSCKKILLALLCSANSELCRLILLSPSPFHLSVTAKWLSPVRRLSSSLSMDRIEEVQRYLTLQYLVNATTTGLQRLPSVPMPVWFWGLNVCLWGQMDTFMSAWVWIILQATSGAPHGTADCGKRGRWARGGGGTPPVGSLTSIPTDRASPQNGRPKGYETILQDKCFSESSQTWCLSLSLTSCVAATAYCFQVSEVSLHVLYLDMLCTHAGNNLGSSVLLKDTVMWTREVGIGPPLLWLMAEHLSCSCL